MSTIKRYLRPILRVVAIGLVVVGAVLTSSWFEVLLQDTALGASGSVGGTAVETSSLPWAIPLLVVGLALLVLTTKRDRYLSLSGRPED